MKTFGLLGHDIAYSLSPIMHNAAFNKLKMRAEYKLFDFDDAGADTFLNSLLRSDISGINITVPYKLKAYEFVKKFGKIGEDAEKLGAINTIAVKDKTIFGYNTDAEGFLMSLKEDLQFTPRKKNVFVFGAGGAGTACAIKMARIAETVYITDLEKEKLKIFQDRFLKYYGSKKLVLVDHADSDEMKRSISECGLLVNATPYGRNKNEMIVDSFFLRKDLKVYDLIYKPPETPVLKKIREMGGSGANGLGMLLYQGALAFEIWTEKKAPVKTMYSALKRAVKAKQRG